MEQLCTDCKGTGRITLLVSIKVCPVCGGTGRRECETPIEKPAEKSEQSCDEYEDTDMD